MTRAAALEALLGLSLTVAGTAMLSVAAAFIVAGVALMASVMLPVIRRGG